MVKARAEVSEACFDDPFGRDFTESLSEFCIASEKDQLLGDKISEDKEEFKRRGLSKHQANMTAEQVKALIPTFNGETSLTVFDALDTYQKILSKSGINKAAWGSVVLSKIEGEARTRLPTDITRDQDLDKIEKHLIFYYESSLVATKAIMQAHERTEPIPDPHQKTPGSLKVLQLHAEIIEHSDRYLSLTPEKTTISKSVRKKL